MRRLRPAGLARVDREPVPVRSGGSSPCRDGDERGELRTRCSWRRRYPPATTPVDVEMGNQIMLTDATRRSSGAAEISVVVPLTVQLVVVRRRVEARSRRLRASATMQPRSLLDRERPVSVRSATESPGGCRAVGGPRVHRISRSRSGGQAPGRPSRDARRQPGDSRHPRRWSRRRAVQGIGASDATAQSASSAELAGRIVRAGG